MLHDYDFRVTLNTDDRLMSGITLTDEYFVAHETFDLTTAQLYKITINGMKSAFQSLAFKKKFITEVLEPKYLALLAEEAALLAQAAQASASAPASQVATELDETA
jgi:adenosine deaminase